MKKIITSILVLAVIFAHSIMAEGAGNVAIVKMMRGKVTATYQGKEIKVKKGDWIKEGTIIKTPKKSFVRLVFIDKSTVNVGPKSELKVEKFSKKEAGILNLVKGKIRSQVTKDYLEMEKGQKSKLYVKSPSAVMGIRGTDFMFSHSHKTGASSAVLFEGNVSFSRLKPGERLNYAQMEKYVDRDNIRIRPGEFSVASRKAKSATIPAVLNLKQRETLEKNTNFNDSTRTPASSNANSSASNSNGQKKGHSVVPPGLSGKIVANDNAELKKTVATIVKPVERGPASIAPVGAPVAPPPTTGPAEGFIADNGAVKPANGSFVHIETGTVIAPPEESAYDPNTNAYIPPETAGDVSATGEYIPPENIIYKEQTGEFVQVVENGGMVQEHTIVQADATMPAEPIVVSDGGANTQDPVLGGYVPPPENQYQNDIYNNQYNPDGLNDFSNINGYNGPNNGAAFNNVVKARVGFDFTIQP